MNGKLTKRFGNRFEVALNFAHDLIFPKRCLGCGKFDSFICPQCFELLKVKKSFCCPICNREMIIPETCSDCSNKSVLNKLWVVSDYDNELTKEAIHLIKYSFCEQVEEVWQKLIAIYFGEERFWSREALLVPVPLHRRRYLERGFNQSILICRILNEIKGNDINDGIIKRIRYGRHQANLDYSMRKESINNCFDLISGFNKREILDREVILVDDVYTTGATMQECARTLKRGGFDRIYGFAMARG